MIQRPQTLFLALAIIGNAIATSGISIWQKIGTSGQKAELFANQWQLFQNGKRSSRAQQYRDCPFSDFIDGYYACNDLLFQKPHASNDVRLNQLAGFSGGDGLCFWVIFKEAMPTFEPEIQGKYGYGFYALVVSLLANMIANRLIRKDEMLVQSSNRMR